MIKLTLSVSKNAKLVRQGLHNLRAEIPKIGKARLYEAMRRIVTKMQVYPPKRPGQKYRRTFRFQKAWRIKASENGYVIENGMPYAKYPVGNAYGQGQAWMHVGRWQLFRDVADAEIGKEAKAIQSNVVMVARRMVGG